MIRPCSLLIMYKIFFCFCVHFCINFQLKWYAYAKLIVISMEKKIITVANSNPKPKATHQKRKKKSKRKKNLVKCPITWHNVSKSNVNFSFSLCPFFGAYLYLPFPFFLVAVVPLWFSSSSRSFSS